MQLYSDLAPTPSRSLCHARDGGDRVSIVDKIRRYARGTCWIGALVVFVLGLGATIYSWTQSEELPRGLITWAVLSIIVLVLTGRWVGPQADRADVVILLHRVSAQLESLQAGQEAILGKCDDAIKQAHAQGYVAGAKQRVTPRARLLQLPRNEP